MSRLRSPLPTLLLVCICSSALFIPAQPAAAQVGVELRPGIVTGDTVRVEVLIGTDNQTLPSPVTAFQFQVVTDDSTVTFLDVSSAFTLVDREGWTVRANPANGKVGGFSSSLDAVKDGGILLTLLFQKVRACDPFDLALDIFKLNSGNPDHDPNKPFITVVACK